MTLTAIAHGCHVICEKPQPNTVDEALSWLGKFASLSAALPLVSDRKSDAEGSYVIRFRLANGVEGVWQNTAGAWAPITDVVRVAGTSGRI